MSHEKGTKKRLNKEARFACLKMKYEMWSKTKFFSFSAPLFLFHFFLFSNTNEPFYKLLFCNLAFLDHRYNDVI